MQRSLVYSFFALFLAICGHQPVLAKPEMTGIAVINLKAEKGIDPSMASLMSDILRTELYNSRRFTVMNREDMDVILKEIAFQQSGACDETACIVQMGQALGVSKMVAGSIGVIGNKYVINAKLINVESFTNEILVTEYMTVDSKDGPEKSFRSIAWQLAGLKKPKFRDFQKEKQFGFYLTGGYGFMSAEYLNPKPVSGVYKTVSYSVTPNSVSQNAEGQYFGVGLKFLPAKWLLLEAAYIPVGYSSEFAIDLRSGGDAVNIGSVESPFVTIDFIGLDFSVNWVKDFGGKVRFLTGAGLANYWTGGMSQFVGNRFDFLQGSDSVQVFFEIESVQINVGRPYLRAGAELRPQKKIGISIFSDFFLRKHEETISARVRAVVNAPGGATLVDEDIPIIKLVLPRFSFDLALAYYF